MSKTNRSKSATLLRISHTVFQLEERHGHLGWKVTDLVRKTKLSRSLIYTYLGSSKKEILLSALRYFLQNFYALEKFENPEGPWIQIKYARERMIQFPEAIIFYQKWRARNSWLQAEFVAIERKFQHRLKSDFPHLTETQVLGLHAVIHGLVTAPFLTSQEVDNILQECFLQIGISVSSGSMA